MSLNTPSRVRSSHSWGFFICTFAVFVLAASDSAHGQSFRGGRGYRFSPIPVPVPVLPSVRYGYPSIRYPVGPSVRIQSPFFSLNVGPGVYPPVPSVSYGYRYESNRSSYSSRSPYSYRSPRSSGYSYGAYSVPRPSSPLPYKTLPPQNSMDPLPRSYRPGVSGGLPEVSGGFATPSFTPNQDPSGSPMERDGTLSLSRLDLSAQALSRALSRQGEEGEVWLDYLQPETIASAAASGAFADELVNLQQRFEGVTQNPELRSIVNVDGFRMTFQQLTRWVEQSGIAIGDDSFSSEGRLKEPAEPIESSEQDGASFGEPADDFEILPSPVSPSSVELDI